MKPAVDSEESYIKRETSSGADLNLEIYEQDSLIPNNVIDLRPKDAQSDLNKSMKKQRP